MVIGGRQKSRGSVDGGDAYHDRAGVLGALNVITGTNGDDVLIGTAGDDLFRTRLGEDYVDGGGGNDTLLVDYSGTGAGPGPQISSFYSDVDGAAGFLGGGAGSSCEFYAIDSLRFTCWDGDDSVTAALALLEPGASIEIDGGGGVNTLGLYAYAARPGGPMVFAVGADGTAVSNMGTFINFDSFFLLGGSADDDLATGDGDDLVYGRKGDDRLSGGGGDDQLFGDVGADTLTGGGGADLFAFRLPNSSRTDNPDRITDFSRAEGDKVDVSAIDADKSVGRDQAFIFIGGSAFGDADSAGGELRARDNGDGTFTVEGDVNRDDIADFAILVSAADPLVAGDFVL